MNRLMRRTVATCARTASRLLWIPSRERGAPWAEALLSAGRIDGIRELDLASEAEEDAPWIVRDVPREELGRSPWSERIVFESTTPSTQLIGQELGDQLPNDVAHGLVVTCDEQTAGRGRGSNAWSSPRGALLFSFNAIVPPDRFRDLPLFQHLVSLAVVSALRDLPELEDVEVRIKWPNDIYARPKPPRELPERSGSHPADLPPVAPACRGFVKVGGILCQTSMKGGRGPMLVTTGVGLNIADTHPFYSLQEMRATDGEAGGDRISRGRTFYSILQAWGRLWEQYADEGFSDSLRSDYEALWLHSGQRVRARDAVTREGGTVGSGEESFSITGISPGGSLLVEDDAGRRWELVSDANSLDLLEGLVKRKL